MQLSHLVVQHPQVSSKETCQECLTDLEDKRALIERDGSLSVSQRKRQLEEKDRQIHRLYWKTSKKASGRIKHFAFCRFQASDIKAACREAKNGGDASSDEGKNPRAGKSRRGNAPGKGKGASTKSATASTSSKKRFRDDDEQGQVSDGDWDERYLSEKFGTKGPAGKQKAKRHTKKASDQIDHKTSSTAVTNSLAAPDGSVEEGEEPDVSPASVPHPLQAERLSVEPMDADFTTYFAARQARTTVPHKDREHQGDSSDAGTEDSLPSRSVSREATASTGPSTARTRSTSRSVSVPWERNLRGVIEN